MSWLVVKRNCWGFSGTTLLKLACFVNTANNTSKYQSLSLISYPRDERLSKVCSSFSCSKSASCWTYSAASSSDGTSSTESGLLNFLCLYHAKTIQESFLWPKQLWNSSPEGGLQYSLDQRLESITSRQKHNRFEKKYRNSSHFHTAGSLEHKFIMADSKTPVFKAQYFQFTGPKLHFSDQDRYSHIG